MAKRLLTPTFENEKQLFQGPRFTVRSLTVTGHNGKAVRRDVVVHPGAVVILPLLDEHRIIMIRNRRFAVGQELWELPAGTLEAGEEPEATARREIIEETGYRAEKMESLFSFYTTPGICNEAMYAYTARGLAHVGQDLDDSEEITVETVSWKQALEMVRDGTIVDGKTIATLLYYKTFAAPSPV